MKNLVSAVPLRLLLHFLSTVMFNLFSIFIVLFLSDLEYCTAFRQGEDFSKPRIPSLE
jgi:hypothetical protein